MPKFIYSLGFVSITILGGIVLLTNKINPQENYSIPLFLVLIFLFFFVLISILLFFLTSKKMPIFTNSRKIYRKGIVQSLLLSSIITGLIGLKIYKTLTPVTGILLIAFGISIINAKAVNKQKR